MEITFRRLSNNSDEFKQLYKWCKKPFVYEWFEQRELSYDEIVKKYTDKLNNQKQDLLIIQYDFKDIGFTQIYKYDDSMEGCSNVYEFDLFIGEEEYLNKGLGKDIVNMITEFIYSTYNADAIVLRPFKRNIRAIKCYEKCNYKKINEYAGKDTLNNPEEITVLINKKH